MTIDDILNLPLSSNPQEQVRDRVARTLNEFLERGENSSYTECAIFQFRTPEHKVTNKTEDLIKCLVLESINFPPFPCDTGKRLIENDADFRYCIINGREKFKVWKQCNG